MPESRSDTKEKIFGTALRLFATSGVENVSMRDIADAVGIKAASIYNHYASKDEIVEACYAYYHDNHALARLPQEQYIPILLEGSKEDILRVPDTDLPEEMTENIVSAMIVLFSRIHTDAKATEVYTKTIDLSLAFLDEYFHAAIRVGRLEAFDVRGFSMLFLSARLFYAQSVSIHPEAFHDWSTAHQEMIEALMHILPFRY